MKTTFGMANQHRSSRGRVAALLVAAVVMLFFVGAGRAAHAQLFRKEFRNIPGANENDTTKRAFLIGVESYQFLPSLRYTANDVVQLAKTLVNRGGFSDQQIILAVDSDDYFVVAPTRKELMESLTRFLNNTGEDQQAIVYFSGHGYQADDGTMYLCPKDCDPRRPAETGIPVTWLREQLAACKANFKLLVLDACHAGSEKGDDLETPSSKDLGEAFRDLTGVVTLASSTGDEKSLLWEEKQQSLFSYWFTQGLKGHADENGDTEIDIDELNKYVHRNVTHVAQTRFKREQTPVRIVRSGAPGVPVVIKLRPRGLQDVLTDMADQLAWAIDDRRLNNVAVLEFAADTPVGELLGVNFGLLGKLCSSKLEERLTSMSYNRFSVIDSRRLVKALQDLEFTIDDLASDERLGELSNAMGSVPILALGTLRNRSGRSVTLQCKLVDAGSGSMAASAGGLALLTESEWAMLGRSVHSPDRPLPGFAPASHDEPPKDAVDQLDEESTGPHPFLDPRFPFPIRVMIGGEERRGIFHGNDYYVPVRKGEVYSLEVNHRGQDKVCMRLLVDGLNTLPQKAVEKGVEILEVAPRVSLEDARHWILDPKKSRRFAIRGFVTQTGRAGTLREFKIVDLEESVAARRQFTDQVGLITAAFYDVWPELDISGFIAGAAPGTGFGRERQERLVESEARIRSLISVVHIRYVDADALVEMQRQWAAAESGS